MGGPDSHEGALRGVRRVAAQARFASLWPTPGAVHINARARKPLEPAKAISAEEMRVAEVAKRIASSPIGAAYAPSNAPNPAGVAAVCAECRAARRGLILCGPAPMAQLEDRAAIFELAARLHFPIACEATSQLRFVDAPRGVTVIDVVDALFASPTFARRAAPDFALQIGAPPVSSGWERMAANPTLRRAVLAPHGWNDPQSSASALVFAEPAASARALCHALVSEKHDPSREQREWSRLMREAAARAQRVIDADLATHPLLTEGQVCRIAVACAPQRSTLMVGNSLAVRLVDTFCPRNASAIAVLSQRGVSGIDGLVAGAAGAASKATTAVTLLLGDVGLLHDMTSLALARKVRVPLVIVVLQNNGGRMFEQLPVASAPDIEPEVLEMTLTPHAIDFAHAAATFGIGFVRVDAASGLEDALTRAYGQAECTMIEATVAPHGAVEQQRRIVSGVDAAINDLLPVPRETC